MLPLYSCQRSVDNTNVSLFLNSPFYSVVICVCSFADTTLPWLLQLCKSWVLLIFWLCSPSVVGLLPLHVDFEIVSWNQQNNLLGFLLKLGWLYRSSWGELTSWQYWAFPPMNMKYLSSYLVLFLKIYFISFVVSLIFLLDSCQTYLFPISWCKWYCVFHFKFYSFVVT